MTPSVRERMNPEATMMAYSRIKLKGEKIGFQVFVMSDKHII
jgi:hypothetical protein